MSDNRWYKNNDSDNIWWKDTPGIVGEWLFSFDKKKIYNLFADYPHNLTVKEKKFLMRKILNGKNFLGAEHRYV